MKIGIDPESYIKEYNRKTTDFGNGAIEITAYHSPRIKYFGGNQRASAKKEAEISDKAQEERTRKQLYAIRRRIKGYALSNDFKWFVTLTFNPGKIDSFNYETAKTALLKWCRQMRDKYNKFDYLLIPELHKSGAVHFHGLLGDVPADFAEAVNPKNGKPLIKNKRQVYNLIDWKHGFSNCQKIESPQKSASYITKYITTSLLANKEMYKKKRYFNSQGLIQPTVTLAMSDNTELSGFIPNFGVVDTDHNGKNFIDIGVYNMMRDNETGTLIQENTDYVIKAKN